MTPTPTPEDRARKRAGDWASVWWHVVSYLVINAFLWFIDGLNGGIEWVYWVTIPWAVGLVFHVAAYVIETRGQFDRKYEQFLAEEHERDAAHRSNA